MTPPESEIERAQAARRRAERALEDVHGQQGEVDKVSEKYRVLRRQNHFSELLMRAMRTVLEVSNTAAEGKEGRSDES
jgi:cob(I)alamin adenosyltransferase